MEGSTADEPHSQDNTQYFTLPEENVAKRAAALSSSAHLINLQSQQLNRRNVLSLEC